MTYAKARQLVLGAGLGILALTTVISLIRRVETVEVIGTTLFIPILIAFVFWGLKGGLIAGAFAGLAYAALRYPAIDAVGAGDFIPLILGRMFAYLAFGGIGGWADKQLEASLNKLELYDQVDDYTGLFNARFFVQDADLELSRSKRYQTVFSVSVVDFPVAPLQKLSRRQRQAIRTDLGRMLKDAVRTVDRAAHGFDGKRHRFASVLPETGPEGARIFTDRLADRVRAYLVEKGVTIAPEDVGALALTFPDDGDAPFQQLKEEFTAIDRHEHPEKQVTSATGQPGGEPTAKT